MLNHLDDGALRRMVDEPLAARDRDRDHLAGCARCQARQAELSRNAAAASRLLAVAEPADRTAAALVAFRNLHTAPAPAPARAWSRARFSARSLGRPAILALGLAVVLVPSAAYGAPALTTLFAPRDAGVRAVPVEQPSQGSIAGLPDLSKYGTMTVVTKPTTSTVLSADEAKSLSGFTPLAAPRGYESAPVSYTVVTASEGKFKLDAAKARQAAVDAGKPAPVFPKGIDGTEIDVKGGPALVQTFGTIDRSNMSLANLPLVVAQAKAPVITSTGASAAQLEAFLLQQPGIADNPELAAQVKAIGDPLVSGSLVVPVPAKYATSSPVKIGGADGVEIVATGGAARAAIWERGTTVYAVGGHLDEAALLDIAGSIR